MTSPFEWRGKPSKIAEELRKDHIRSQNARSSGPGKPFTLVPPLEPRRFHVYSKAGTR